VGLASLCAVTAAVPGAEDFGRIAPCALAVSDDGTTLYIACEAEGQVLVLDLGTTQVNRRIHVPCPSGLALSGGGSRLYVTSSAPRSQIVVLDTSNDRVLAKISLGHTAQSPVLSHDGDTLFVCNRFNSDVSVVSLKDSREVRRIAVPREPVAAALTPDNAHLVVANHLHTGRADRGDVGAEVTIIDTASSLVSANIKLPNGSNLLRGVAVSPDGHYAAVTHVLARYYLPAIQVDRGWMNNNALSLVDLEAKRWLITVLLDELDMGAANPWGVSWSGDGGRIIVAHAGTHELSCIDAFALLRKVTAIGQSHAAALAGATSGNQVQRQIQFEDASNDLLFMSGMRRRVALPGAGPRQVVLAGSVVYVANYFSDDLCRVDLADPRNPAMRISLGPTRPRSTDEEGEARFNDGTLCYQHWQSCASCHDADARVDGLNWDLLNDGIGNPKNTRSLLFCDRTPPAMSEGVRESSKDAVRAGIHYILFGAESEEAAQSIDQFLRGLRPLGSPHRQGGQLSDSAVRGAKLFADPRVGCVVCHPPGLFTDLRRHDVGTRASFDTVGDFDTPTLIESWRTAPYLHDGSAATIVEAITLRNRADRHGRTSHLTRSQIEDLAAYVLSQ